MKFRLLWIVTLAMVWSLGAGCTNQTSSTKLNKTPERRIEDFFPLKVGIRRVYKVRDLTGMTYQVETRIARKKGQRFFEMERRLAQGLKQKASVSRQSGFYEFDEFGLRGKKRYLLKHPLRVGTKWLSVIDAGRVEKYEIISVGRTVRVPAGTYENCIFVRSRDQRERNDYLENHIYFAPGVGIVKIMTASHNNGRRRVQWLLELSSFRRPSVASAPAATK